MISINADGVQMFNVLPSPMARCSCLLLLAFLITRESALDLLRIACSDLVDRTRRLDRRLGNQVGDSPVGTP